MLVEGNSFRAATLNIGVFDGIQSTCEFLDLVNCLRNCFVVYFKLTSDCAHQNENQTCIWVTQSEKKFR